MHEKALDLDPSSAQALCDYAELLLSRGGVGAQEQHALAIQLLDRCFTACPPPQPRPDASAEGDEAGCVRDAHAYSRARSRYLYGWALVVGGDTEGGEAVLHDVAEEWFSLHLMLVEGAHSVARCDIDLLGVSAAAWGTLGMLAVRAGDWTVAERHLHASLRAGLAASLAAKLLAFGGKGGGGRFQAVCLIQGLSSQQLVSCVGLLMSSSLCGKTGAVCF